MNAIEAGAEINRARAERIVHSASHMAWQVGPALEHLRRRRPIRPLAFHGYCLRPGPGKTLPANADAIPDRFARPEDIIEAALTCRDDDRAPRIAAVPSDDLARYGLFPKRLRKSASGPRLSGLKLASCTPLSGLLKARAGIRSEGEKDSSAGKCADHCCPLVLPARERCTSQSVIRFKFCGQSWATPLARLNPAAVLTKCDQEAVHPQSSCWRLIS